MSVRSHRSLALILALAAGVLYACGKNSAKPHASSGGSTSTGGSGSGTTTGSTGSSTGSTTGSTGTEGTLTAIAVQPGNATLIVGATTQLAAIGTFTADGGSFTAPVAATWTTSNTTDATVDANGVVTGKAAGTVTITATAQGLSASAAVTVRAASCTSLSVQPGSWTMSPGASYPFSAIARGCIGAPQQDVTQSAATTWSVLNGGSATGTVSSTGLFTAGSNPGTVYLQATFTGSSGGPLSGTATINISSATVTGIAVAPSSATLNQGSSQQFNATATFSDGSSQPVTSAATWSSSDAAIASTTCTNTPGNVCAVGAGSATLTASYGGQSGAASVTVVAPSTLTGVAVSPASTDVPQGPSTCTQLTANGTYSNGTTSPVTANWTADTGLSLTRRNAATTQACTDVNVATGAYNVTASSSGFSGSATINVCSTTAAGVTVSPLQQTIRCRAGGTNCAAFNANATLSYCGQTGTFDVTSQSTWQIAGAPSTLTVNGGLVCLTGSCPGTPQSYSLTASYGGQSGTASVFVQ